jgi:hypothetical protein
LSIGGGNVSVQGGRGGIFWSVLESKEKPNSFIYLTRLRRILCQRVWYLRRERNDLTLN